MINVLYINVSKIIMNNMIYIINARDQISFIGLEGPVQI